LSVLSVAEFNKQTGSGRYADVVIQEIIDQAEREIQGWIDLYNLPATVTKAGSSLLSKAGYYERLFMDGALPGESGAKYYGLDRKANDLRTAAKALYFATEDAAVVAASVTPNYSVKVANS